MNFLRTCSVIVVVGLLIMAVMAGCEWFDSSSPTEPTGVAEGPLAGNFICGPAENTDWAGYYKPGQTYFKVTIPVIGTATIRYWLAGGGCFAIYVQTLAPVTVEIGLLTHADGTVDRLGNVTVEYVAGGSFAALPENAVAHQHADYVHYWRKDADETEHPWWLCDTSGFAVEGIPHTHAIIRDGVLLVEQGLPAQRPEPEPAPAPEPGPSYPNCVAQTGQTSCWDANGISIPCADTGQDGEYQMGCPPVVAPAFGASFGGYNRTSFTPGEGVEEFTDNGDGTVTDNWTGLIWLENANCFGRRGWTDALSVANELASGQCGLSDGSSAGDWRLPNFNELRSLFDPGLPTPYLPAGQSFTGVQSYHYWSGTTFASYPRYAWGVDLGDGGVYRGFKAGTRYVWPVRGGE